MSKKSAAKAFEEESRFSPLVIAVISVFITAGVFIGADLLNKTVDYSTQEPEEPVRVSARRHDPDYSPDRAKRRAGYFLGRRADQPEPDAEPEADTEEETEAEENSGANNKPESEAVKEERPAAEAENAPEDFGSYTQSADGVTLQGVMVGGDSGIAVLSLGGVSHTLSEGQTIKGYKVQKVLSDRVILQKGDSSVTLSLSTASGAETAMSENSQGHPVLPNPRDVPPPARPGAASSSGSARKKTAGGGTAGSGDPLASPVPFSQTDDYDDVYESGSGGVPEPARVEVKDFASSGKRFESYYEEDKGQTSAGIKSPAPDASPTPMRPSREELNGYLKRGAAIISEVRATPDDEAMGVKLKFLKNDNIFSRLGLQDGDIVTRINNKTVLSSEELFNSVLTVSEMPFVNIEYKRKGQDGSLVYDL